MTIIDINNNRYHDECEDSVDTMHKYIRKDIFNKYCSDDLLTSYSIRKDDFKEYYMFIAFK